MGQTRDRQHLPIPAIPHPRCCTVQRFVFYYTFSTCAAGVGATLLYAATGLERTAWFSRDVSCNRYDNISSRRPGALPQERLKALPTTRLDGHDNDSSLPGICSGEVSHSFCWHCVGETGSRWGVCTCFNGYKPCRSVQICADLCRSVQNRRVGCWSCWRGCQGLGLPSVVGFHVTKAPWILRSSCLQPSCFGQIGLWGTFGLIFQGPPLPPVTLNPPTQGLAAYANMLRPNCRKHCKPNAQAYSAWLFELTACNSPKVESFRVATARKPCLPKNICRATFGAPAFVHPVLKFGPPSGLSPRPKIASVLLRRLREVSNTRFLLLRALQALAFLRQPWQPEAGTHKHSQMLKPRRGLSEPPLTGSVMLSTVASQLNLAGPIYPLARCSETPSAVLFL